MFCASRCTIVYNLTVTQREVLIALVNLYNKHKRMIKSREVAEVLGKDEGTVRNIISSLKALGLVESKTGPGGGYIPTIKSYEIVKMPTYTAGYEFLKLIKNGVETEIRVINIEFLDLTNPLGNRAVLKVAGDVSSIRIGDYVKLGPTPYTRMIIEGRVLNADNLRKEIVIDIVRLISIPREPVRSIASRRLITIPPNVTIREAASLLYKEKIRGAPVVKDGKIIGLVTTSDIAGAISNGISLDEPVEKIMRREVHTIREDEDILEAVRQMMLHNIGRLIVVDSEGKPVGIVTRTDVLRRIAGLESLWAL